MENRSMDKLRFMIQRNFCAQYDAGDLRGEKGVDGRPSALVGMSPERLKVYLEEYAQELTFPVTVEEHQKGARIAAEDGNDTQALLRFVAKLPLRGESADAVRSLTEALSKEKLGLTIEPGSLKLTNEGISLLIGAPAGRDASELLADLRRMITPKGFAVEIYQ